MQNQASIQAFFNQAKGSDTRWWTWLVVFWFAIILWFYGQVFFGIPVMLFGVFSDGSSLETLLENKDGAGAPFAGLAMVIVFLMPILSLLLWVFRNQFTESSRDLVLKFAGAGVIISSVALIYTIITGSGGGETELINTWLSKNSIVYMFILLMFPPLAIGLWLGVRFIQKRTILSLHTAHFKFRWGRMVFAMLVIWAIAAVSSYGAHVTGVSEAKLVFDPSRFWKYLPITLLLIPLQSATEEIALRGYLNQGIGKYIKNPWIVFVITSAAFASLHLGNPEVVETIKEHSVWVAMSGYFFFGFFACVLTYIDGGLEAAIGMHAANNMFAAAVVGYDSSALPTPTIFKVGLNTPLDSIMVVVNLILVCLIMYATRKPLIPAKSPESTFT